jgi:hypothetical protein
MQHIHREGQQPIDPTPRELICRLPVLLLAGQGRSLFAGLAPSLTAGKKRISLPETCLSVAKNNVISMLWIRLAEAVRQRNSIGVLRVGSGLAAELALPFDRSVILRKPHI